MNDRRIRSTYIRELSEQHSRLDDDVVRRLHSKFKATRDKADHEALILHLLPMVLSLVGELQIPEQFIDDVIQAGNLAILKYLPAWDDTKGQTLSTYLYPAVRSDMLRELDDLQSCGVLSREWDRAYVESSEETVEAANEHNEKLEDVVLIQQLRKAINVLDEPDRAVMLLIADDKSQHEVADTLNIPRRTVSRIVKRATVRLSSILK